MSKEIPQNSAYEDARLSFGYGASKFKDLAKKNVNFELEPLSIPNFLRQLNGSTDDKINERTVQDGSNSRKLAFQQIASIIASSKVLVRSE